MQQELLPLPWSPSIILQVSIVVIQGLIVARVHRQQNVTLVEVEKPTAPPVEAGRRRKILASETTGHESTVERDAWKSENLFHCDSSARCIYVDWRDAFDHVIPQFGSSNSTLLAKPGYRIHHSNTPRSPSHPQR